MRGVEKYVDVQESYGECLQDECDRLYGVDGLEIVTRLPEVFQAIVAFTEEPSGKPLTYEELGALCRTTLGFVCARRMPPREYLCAALEMTGEFICTT